MIQVASPLDLTILEFAYSKKKKKVLNIMSHMGLEPIILRSIVLSSMGRVVTPGGDLLDDLLTPCTGTLRSIAFTI